MNRTMILWHIVLLTACATPPPAPAVWLVGTTVPPDRIRHLPCSDTQEALNGGCWYRLAQKPPCGPEQFHSGDGCFLPVLAFRQPVGGRP